METLANKNNLDKINKNYVDNSTYSKKKDANPLDTISKIRGIFAKYNIIPLQMWVSHNYNTAEDFVYSNRIALNGLFPIGANGKGTTLEYALASGICELMERIESTFILRRHIRISSNLDLYLSETEMYFSKEDFCKVKNSFFDKYFLNFFQTCCPDNNIPKFKNSGELIDFLEEKNLFESRLLILSQYYSLKDKDTVLLPKEFLDTFFVGTNGHSAGNTKEEALVQAISEVYERYCMSQILYNGLNMPDIPLEKYSKYDEIIKIIENYKKLGIEIKIKDASLGENYSVVAAIATDTKTNKSVINFGSHPILAIAIERTLTEIAQSGNIHDTVNKTSSDYFDASYYNKSAHCNSAFLNTSAFDKRILKKELTWAYEDATWSDENLSNKELLKNMIKQCLNKDFDIYIKDLSFLDFPCFNVYIPKLSNIIGNFNIIQSATQSGQEGYTLGILEKLKNNQDIEQIYQEATLMFNLLSDRYFYEPKELIYIIAIIAGFKLKKFEDLRFIVDMIFYNELDKYLEFEEFMNVIKPIISIIKFEEFSKIEKHIDNLLDYCFKKADEYMKNCHEPDSFSNLEQEKLCIENSKVTKAFEDILKTRKEKSIDNLYLKNYFEEIIS